MHRAICQIPMMLAEIWLPEIIMEVSWLDPSAHNREVSEVSDCKLVNMCCAWRLPRGIAAQLDFCPYTLPIHRTGLVSVVWGLQLEEYTQYCGPEGSLIFQVDTGRGQAVENHHRIFQLERRMRHRMCHWKDRINWNLPLKSPTSEHSAITGVRVLRIPVKVKTWFWSWFIAPLRINTPLLFWK